MKTKGEWKDGQTFVPQTRTGKIGLYECDSHAYHCSKAPTKMLGRTGDEKINIKNFINRTAIIIEHESEGNTYNLWITGSCPKDSC